MQSCFPIIIVVLFISHYWIFFQYFQCYIYTRKSSFHDRKKLWIFIGVMLHTQKIWQYILTHVELTSFYKFKSKPTIGINFFLLKICHISMCQICCHFFFFSVDYLLFFDQQIFVVVPLTYFSKQCNEIGAWRLPTKVQSKIFEI